MSGRTLLTARWVVGHEDGRHCLIENGEVVLDDDRIVFVGQGFPGEVAARHDYGLGLLGPGLIDLDALADLDTTVLGLDNQPAAEKGRIWPRTYVARGPYEMYSPEELAFQKRYAFAQLLRRGITTALPRPGRDLEIIRDAGATVVHCPIVSARGGRALESFARCRAMRLRVGLGTDTWPPDLVANMQAGLMLCRVVEGSPSLVSAADFYDAATIGGADALSRPDLGRLAPGAAADVVVFDLSDGYMVPGLDPVQALLAGGAARYARAVWVAGQLVAERGELPGFDMNAAHARAQTQFARVVSLYPDRTWRHPLAEKIFASSYRLHSGEAVRASAVVSPRSSAVDF